MPTLARLAHAEEKLHRRFPSQWHWRAAASIDSISSRRCWAVRRARSATLRASTSIRVRLESPPRSMAWRDEGHGEQLRLPLQPAIAPSGRVRETLDPRVSVRYRERGASGVARLPRPQGPEFAYSTKVVTWAAFAVLPPSDFRLRQPR